MKRLNKHKLDFESAYEYIKDNLDKVNALSAELLKLVNFKNGHFFTLLPDNANFERIYDFEWGGVLPPNPIEECIVNGHKSTYSIKNSINDELSPLILKEIKSKYELSCVFDKVSGTPSNAYYIYYSDAHPLFNEKEVYFLIEQKNISIDVLLKCLRASTSFWHSLCVFTTADFNGVTETLSLEKIKEICLKTQLVMVGAYDGEGYLFWEKNITNASIEFFAE
jgi:hypothetical protein